MDNNFWKNAYKSTWGRSSEKEQYMIQWIKTNTGLTAVPTGLGAATDDFINGSAVENGFEKGDPDLHIQDTNVYIEVTGPLSDSVLVSAPLWFRPDKFNNAVINARKGHDTFFVHHCPSADLWRVIHIDDVMIQRMYNKEFQIVTPVIHGNIERYVEIPATDRCVKPLEFFKQYLLKKHI